MHAAPSGKAETQFLVDELAAVGTEYQHRRAAGVAGLAIADKLDTFAALRDYTGKPIDVDVGRLTALDKSDRYLKRILPRWDKVVAALGGEDAVLERFEVSAETMLPLLDPGTPNAKRLFDLLDGKPDPRVTLDIRLAALRRFAPEGPVMRGLIEPLLRRGGSTSGMRLSNKERWPSFMAAEIFAEHFAHSELRQIAIDQLSAAPNSDCAAAALAETVLRERDAALEDLLQEKTRDRRYDLVTVARVTAAIGNIVGVLERVLEKDPQQFNGLNCGYWVPAVLRRIERDSSIADALIEAADDAPSASARLSELTLLGRGCKDISKTRPALERALQTYESAAVPTVAYDVTTESYRLAAQAIRQLLS